MQRRLSLLILALISTLAPILLLSAWGGGPRLPPLAENAFLDQRMPRLNHHRVDPIEHLGREQAQVVLKRLHVPQALFLRPIAVPEPESGSDH